MGKIRYEGTVTRIAPANHREGYLEREYEPEGSYLLSYKYSEVKHWADEWGFDIKDLKVTIDTNGQRIFWRGEKDSGNIRDYTCIEVKARWV